MVARLAFVFLGSLVGRSKGGSGRFGMMIVVQLVGNVLPNFGEVVLVYVQLGQHLFFYIILEIFV